MLVQINVLLIAMAIIILTIQLLYVAASKEYT